MTIAEALAAKKAKVEREHEIAVEAAQAKAEKFVAVAKYKENFEVRSSVAIARPGSGKKICKQMKPNVDRDEDDEEKAPIKTEPLPIQSDVESGTDDAPPRQTGDPDAQSSTDIITRVETEAWTSIAHFTPDVDSFYSQHGKLITGLNVQFKIDERPSCRKTIDAWRMMMRLEHVVRK